MEFLALDSNTFNQPLRPPRGSGDGALRSALEASEARFRVLTESGLDLIRKIREDHGDIPIAIITSYDLPEYRLAGQECGASCFFSKIASSAQEIFAWIVSAAPAVVIP